MEDSADQEKEMNKYFVDMKKIGIDTDEDVLFNFTKVMVHESIELSQHTREG